MDLLYTENNYKPSLWLNTNAQEKKFIGNNFVSHECVCQWWSTTGYVYAFYLPLSKSLFC